MSKKQYMVWLSEEEVYKVYFQADSKDHATELLEQLRDGHIAIEELPDIYKRTKEYIVSVDPTEVEEIPDV